ncbi:MAG: sulfite exporter TauE/SafE family protein [Clostridia bacterium]|nr:sulfite exporter TauE/SafE family protein [Clostridia bacterium]MBR2296376.1 sulfite exporter TauE/SafE family protein [Clostridia bacterium]
MKLEQKLKIKNITLFCVLSFVAGGINGFLGTGGGIILVYMLGALTENDKKDSFASTLCATIPMSIVSITEYARASAIDLSLARSLAIPAIVGGALGAFLTDKIKAKYLTLCFSLLVIYSGICMVTK